MKTTTEYLWFNTKTRQEFIRITDQVAEVVAKSGVQEGMVLVSAMHISASVFVNDHESGCGMTSCTGWSTASRRGTRSGTGTTTPGKTTPPPTCAVSPSGTR